MATKGKVVNGKEKRGLSSSGTQHIDIPNERRNPKLSTSGSPDDKNFSILSEKATPHYLKPTISSGLDVCKYPKKQGSVDNTLIQLHTRRGSFDKSSSSSQIQKAIPPSSLRDRTQKPSSPSGKSITSSRSFSDRSTSKTTRNEKVLPLLTNQKSIKKSTSSNIKKETKASATTNKTPSNSDIFQSTSIKPELENKEPSVNVSEEEIVKADCEEVHSGISLSEDEKPMDVVDSELKTPEDEKPQFCDSSTLSDDQEAFPAPQIEEAEEKRENKTNDKRKEDEENCKIHEDNNHSNKEEDGLVELENSWAGEPMTDLEAKKDSITEDPNSQNGKGEAKDDSRVENNQSKLKFKQEEMLDEDADNDEGSQRLKFKERGDVEGNEEAKPNVVLKRQDTRGKKESMAYNDVIEETASKLVGKRKSKVKALVGAFETVISLQEPEGQPAQTLRANDGGIAETEPSSM